MIGPHLLAVLNTVDLSGFSVKGAPPWPALSDSVSEPVLLCILCWICKVLCGGRLELGRLGVPWYMCTGS